MESQSAAPVHRASRRRLSAPLLLGAALLLTGASYATARLAATPAAVANVNIHTVMEKLTQRAEMEVELASIKRKSDEELRARLEALDARSKAADELPAAERQAARDDVALAQLQLREWAKMEKQTVELEEALQWQNLYRGIQQEAERLAEAEGYDYVFVYDGTAPIERNRASEAPLGQQVVDQIMRRRVLYAASKDDVTERLVMRMNNAYASGAKASTSSGAAPTTSTENNR